MEPNEEIQLRDPGVYPDENVLKEVLGSAYSAFHALLALFDRYEMHHEWRYYRDGKAWLCKVQKKKRTIIWMSAWKGCIKATLYIPEKHLESLFKLPLLRETMDQIRAAKKIMKSRPCTFEIRDRGVLGEIEKVADFKIRHP